MDLGALYDAWAPRLLAYRITITRDRHRAEDGDGEAARESIRDGLAVADSLRDEPVVVSQLVLLVDVGILVDALGHCITAETPVPELKAWLSLLPPVSKFDGMMEKALRGELACTVGMVEQSNDDIAFADNTLSPALSHRLAARLSRPLIRWDLPRYARLLRRILDLSRRPYLETQAGADEIDREVRAAMFKWSQPVVQSLIPAVNRIFRNQAACQARLAVTRAGLECEIARASDGKYPDRIESMDPFTGQPLLLRDGKITSAVPQDTPPIEWKLRRP